MKKLRHLTCQKLRKCSKQKLYIDWRYVKRTQLSIDRLHTLSATYFSSCSSELSFLVKQRGTSYCYYMSESEISTCFHIEMFLTQRIPIRTIKSSPLWMQQ